MNQTLIGFLKKEFRQALRDPRMRMILFVVPIIQMTLFGVAISTQSRNIQLGIHADPSDVLAYRIYQRALATGWFIPAEFSAHGDPFKAIQNNKADAILVAPARGSTLQFERGGANLQLLVNAVNAVRAQSIEAYLLRIANQVLSEFESQKSSYKGVSFETRTLYNPALETSIFMVPGVMGMLICMVSIILTSMAIARERETGTLETLMSAPIKPWEFMLGKTVPFAVIGLSNVPIVLAVAVILFHVPLRGTMWELGCASVVFVLTMVSIGVLLSSIARTQQQAMLGTFLFLFPAILLSGLMFPIENMPDWMKILAHLDPLSHFMALLRSILLRGSNLDLLLSRIGAMLLIGLTSSSLAYYKFKNMLS